MSLRPPRVGEPAPDFTLPAVDGGELALSGMDEPVVLTFLRHLA